jgi:hypothetical protein
VDWQYKHDGNTRKNAFEKKKQNPAIFMSWSIPAVPATSELPNQSENEIYFIEAKSW